MSTVKSRAEADVAKFFSPRTWGQAARFTAAGSPAKTVNGDFVAAFQSADTHDVNVVSSSPAFLCATVDVPVVSRGDEVVVEEGTFYVTRPEVSGAVTVLFLTESEPE